MPKKNEIYSVEITDTTNSGHGVARVNGEVVFVQNACEGDYAEVVIIKSTASYSIARILRLISASPYRIENDCTSYSRCGGCVFRHMTYEYELTAKRRFVESAFHKMGIDLDVPPVESGAAYGYRSKVQYPIAVEKSGKVCRGMFSEYSHNTVCVESCKLEEAVFSPIISDLMVLLNDRGMRVYDEKTHKGLLRHMILRSSWEGKVSLCVVVNSKNYKLFNDIAAQIMQKHDNISGFFVNSNREKTNVIMGDETQKIAGDDKLEEQICGKTFRLAPQSFFQVNRTMAQRLYQKAGELLALTEGEVILDMYCGVGSIGLSVCGNKQRLVGVEVVPQAVMDAQFNAKQNGIDADFICGDASVGIGYTQKKYGRIDAIIVDPPRKGMDDSVIDQIISSGCNKIVYISCNPSTMARDVKRLMQSGFTLQTITPFDLFPRTSHVECVAALTKN